MEIVSGTTMFLRSFIPERSRPHQTVQLIHHSMEDRRILLNCYILRKNMTDRMSTAHMTEPQSILRLISLKLSIQIAVRIFEINSPKNGENYFYH